MCLSVRQIYRFSPSNKNVRRKNRESNQDDPGVGARNGIDRKCQNLCGETSAHKNPRSEIKSGIITRQPKSTYYKILIPNSLNSLRILWVNFLRPSMVIINVGP